MTYTTTDAAEARARLEAMQKDRSTEHGRAAFRLLRRLGGGTDHGPYSERDDWTTVFLATAEAASGAAYPDNTYTPYGRRSVRNLASQLKVVEENPTVVSIINKASDEITFLRALTAAPQVGGAAEAASGAGEREGRFWLIVREPGRMPERKGSWPRREIAHRLREFIAARPRAFIDVLTIGHDGAPEVEHGPEVLQYTDGRSMSVGRKHNQRVRTAAEEALASLPPATDPAMGLELAKARKSIEILRRALAWHGDRQRMATTREHWQQEIDAAIQWVSENPEPDYSSFPTLAALAAAPTIPATGEAIRKAADDLCRGATDDCTGERKVFVDPDDFDRLNAELDRGTNHG